MWLACILGTLALCTVFISVEFQSTKQHFSKQQFFEESRQPSQFQELPFPVPQICNPHILFGDHVNVSCVSNGDDDYLTLNWSNADTSTLSIRANLDPWQPLLQAAGNGVIVKILRCASCGKSPTPAKACEQGTN